MNKWWEEQTRIRNEASVWWKGFKAESTGTLRLGKEVSEKGKGWNGRHVLGFKDWSIWD